MEIWEKVKGYEGVYVVSNLGNVKRLITNKKRKELPLIKSINATGYLNVNLFKYGIQKTYRVNRLVALAFIPNLENKPQINHINGIKTDNRVENLEWVTNKENIIHAIEIGLFDSVGIKNGRSKLTNIDIIEIRNSVLSVRRLGEIYNVSFTTINKIKLRKVWKHL